MARFKPKNLFDKVFEIGILLKGLDGLFEILGGLVLLIVKPERINHIVVLLTSGELTQDPHDYIANHILHWSQQLTRAALLFGAIYLLAHGIAKLVLVIEIFRNHLWAYLGLIVLTALFIIYQTYEVVFIHSISMALLDVFDVVILYLTSREYKNQRRLRAHSADTD